MTQKVIKIILPLKAMKDEFTKIFNWFWWITFDFSCGTMRYHVKTHRIFKPVILFKAREENKKELTSEHQTTYNICPLLNII